MGISTSKMKSTACSIAYYAGSTLRHFKNFQFLLVLSNFCVKFSLEFFTKFSIFFLKDSVYFV